MASKTIYPSIPAPGTTPESMRATLDATRQTLTMLIMNAQNPNPNFVPSTASQIFVTQDQLKKTGVVGPQGPSGPQGPPGPGVAEAPNDANTYGRHALGWVAVTGGGGGGIAEAPSDGTSYLRNNAGWVHLASGDVTTALTYTPYNSTNPAGYQTAAQVTASLGSYAPLASPALTGTPTTPTAAVGTNTTQVASTAFVIANAVPGPAGPQGPVGPAGPTGPTGPAGGSAVSADAGNYATLGSDSLIFVPSTMDCGTF